jgi:DNA-binding MurR/RpiR family transcriptional regulator
MIRGLVKVRAILDQLSPSERKVARQILADPRKAVHSSVAMLADASRSSQASVVRLCRTLGVEGFRELKLEIARDLNELDFKRQSEGRKYKEFQPGDPISTILHNIFQNHVRSLDETLSTLDARMLQKAVQALRKADRIFFFGIGASGIVAQDAAQKFLRINKNCFAMGDQHMQIMSSRLMDRRDVMIGISYSGRTREVARAVEQARKAGAVTITISRYGKNPVIRHSDIPLFVSAIESDVRTGATSSRIVQLSVIDVLYLGVISLDFRKLSGLIDRVNEAVAELKR